MKRISLLSGALALGLALSATLANAAFINGSISFADGFDTLPPPTTSIVSQLTSFDVGSIAQAFGATGSFAGTPLNQTAFDFDINNLPTAFFQTDNGFSFQLDTAVVSLIAPLYCTGPTDNQLCVDGIVLDVTGIVSAAGFTDTLFLGKWTANGTCRAEDATCTSDVSAAWSSSIVAAGIPPVVVPEPTTMALFGLGLTLAGAGYMRRKTATTA